MSKSSSFTSERVVRVRVPFSIRKRGGRKLAVVPASSSTTPARPQVDNTMVKALARAFRWRRMLEAGAYGTIEELAAAEKINSSYVSRVLRMTLLAPDVVEAVLNGTMSPGVPLATLMRPFSMDWVRQRAFWRSAPEAGAETPTRERYYRD